MRTGASWWVPHVRCLVRQSALQSPDLSEIALSCASRQGVESSCPVIGLSRAHRGFFCGCGRDVGLLVSAEEVVRLLINTPKSRLAMAPPTHPAIGWVNPASKALAAYHLPSWTWRAAPQCISGTPEMLKRSGR